MDRKVLIIDDVQSPFIEKAFFIVRENASGADGGDIVMEAERILKEYMENRQSPFKDYCYHRKRKFPIIPACSAGIAALILALYLIFG